MALNAEFVGRVYGPGAPYEVSRVKIAEFADAIGDPNPVYRDPAAARAAGHPDVIAPPTFAMVARAFSQPVPVVTVPSAPVDRLAHTVHVPVAVTIWTNAHALAEFSSVAYPVMSCCAAPQVADCDIKWLVFTAVSTIASAVRVPSAAVNAFALIVHATFDHTAFV